MARDAGLIIKDAIADAFLQQIFLRPAECEVVATRNPMVVTWLMR